MRIGFADFSGWDFHVGSVDTMPMGGSQSAACHLARELARQQHEVFFLSETSAPGVHHGVHCLAWQTTSGEAIRSIGLDAMVVLLAAGFGADLRQLVGPKVRLILWCQHDHDIDDVKSLHEPRERNAYDRLAMVSQWQLVRYAMAFGIEPARMKVMRNAIAPAFAHKFLDSLPILPRKAVPPILAYCSTPFRGLELLIDAFPHIRAAVPETRLQVFSSLKVYSIPANEDEAQFGPLYRRCQETEGADYVGSLPQPKLAAAMEKVQVLAYPNTFAETSCIAVLEAMASGCRIVTSDLGALPDTTAGFARLVPIVGRSRDEYLRQFIDETVAVLRDCADPAGQSEDLLRSQVTHVNACATWPVRSVEWLNWLASF